MIVERIRLNTHSGTIQQQPEKIEAKQRGTLSADAVVLERDQSRQQEKQPSQEEQERQTAPEQHSAQPAADAETERPAGHPALDLLA